MVEIVFGSDLARFEDLPAMIPRDALETTLVFPDGLMWDGGGASHVIVMQHPTLTLTVKSRDDGKKALFSHTHLQFEGVFRKISVSRLKFHWDSSLHIVPSSVGTIIEVASTRFLRSTLRPPLFIKGIEGRTTLSSVMLSGVFVHECASGIHIDGADIVQYQYNFSVMIGSSNRETEAHALWVGPHVRKLKFFENTIALVWGVGLWSAAHITGVARSLIDTCRRACIAFAPSSFSGVDEDVAIVEKCYVLMAGLKPNNPKENPGPNLLAPTGNIVGTEGRTFQLSKIYSQYRRNGNIHDSDLVMTRKSDVIESWQAKVYTIHVVPASKLNIPHVFCAQEDQVFPVEKSTSIQAYAFSQAERSPSGLHKRVNDARHEMNGVIKDKAYLAAGEAKVVAHRSRALTELWKAQGGLKTPLTDALWCASSKPYSRKEDCHESAAE